MKSRFTKQKEGKLSNTKEQKSPGIELGSPALQVDSLPTELSGKLSSHVVLGLFLNFSVSQFLPV